MLLLFPNFQEMTVVTQERGCLGEMCVWLRKETLYQNAVVGDAAVRPLRTHASAQDEKSRLKMGVS